MSGTSVDAIDAVLMDFSESDTQIISSYSHEIESDLRDSLNSLITEKTLPENHAHIDKQFAKASSNAVTTLLKQSSINSNDIIAIGSHGQTIFHDPKGNPAVSIQLGNPQIIANTVGIPTIGNFRQADIDAGGQGAPLACAYHAAVLQSSTEERVVLNLGGIANITKLPSDRSEPIIGFDTGPANTLMDIWIKRHLSKTHDESGSWAKSGKINNNLFKLMLDDDYFAATPPKSTGREHFSIDWLHACLEIHNEHIAPQDTQATLLALTTRTIANSITTWCPNVSNVLLCGGGSENTYLVEQLKSVLSETTIQKTSDYGVPAKWMEAMAFAWLAKQHANNKPGNIPSVTGADKAVKLGELFKPN